MEVKNEKMSLQEATAKALYDQLDDSEEIRDVEGVVDDVLVITDPEITKDEYEEVIERAQEIVEDTPEGDIPFDDEYLGQYLQTCPICGGKDIRRLRRVTGYLTGDYTTAFNRGKQQEVQQRYQHSKLIRENRYNF